MGIQNSPCVHPSSSAAGISATLPWGTRIKVAIGAAKGLAFLHAASTPVIYRDFKASNILLDSVGGVLATTASFSFPIDLKVI